MVDLRKNRTSVISTIRLSSVDSNLAVIICCTKHRFPLVPPLLTCSTDSPCLVALELDILPSLDFKRRFLQRSENTCRSQGNLHVPRFPRPPYETSSLSGPKQMNIQPNIRLFGAFLRQLEILETLKM